ncbi:MAG: ZIP family metal transporter [Usitatibacter sp.]
MSGMPVLALILIACFLGTVLSLAIAALVAFRVQASWISTLVSFAVGAMLGASFLDLLPHLFEESKNPSRTAGFILVGILIFFVLEKVMLWRHHHHHTPEEQAEAEEQMRHSGHDHGRSGWMIIFGDSFHNFTDGVIIASAFLADVKLGVVTSIAIIAHEIPQEIGDFLVLLHSGFSRARALLWNFISGMAAVVGAVLAYFALSSVQQWVPEILAIAVASMIYVAVADLIPTLHKHTAIRETLAQVAFIALGIASIWLIHAGLFPGVESR